MRKGLISILIIIAITVSGLLPAEIRAAETGGIPYENESAVGTDEPDNPEIAPSHDPKTVDRIHFIALNSDGDASEAILIESNGQYGLIDASHPSGTGVTNRYSELIGQGASGQTVVQYLCGVAGVNHLSFVVATHSHSDHIGGIPDIAASGLVDENTVYIYKPYECREENNWHSQYYAEEALKAMRGRGAELLDVNEPSVSGLSRLGAAFTEDYSDSTGDHISFYFGDFKISLYNLHTESMSNENLNSIIATFHKGTESAVLMSDMEMTDGMEERVINSIIRNEGTFSANVFKVAHHGLPNSNGVATLAAFNPRYAVVCTNRTDRDPILFAYYNFILEKTGAEIYRTSEAEAGIVADFIAKDVYIFRMTYSGELDAATPWVTSYQTN